ncbi:MAG: beta-N-acetylhexosaminidase [Candidatus Krumholzibacteriia bacterium]
MKSPAIHLTTLLILATSAGCGTLSGVYSVNPNPSLGIIPVPASIEPAAGSCRLAAGFALKADDKAQGVAAYLAAKVERATGIRPGLSPADGTSAASADAGSVTLRIIPDDPELGAEGYALQVAESGVVIEAPRPAGLFYGVQTLLQLLAPEIEAANGAAPASWTIPCVEIRDRPRYRYRGMHLDVCRHFFDVEFIKRYLDLLTLHKLNTFHWHLTEDQGWRMPIAKYPRLTEVGGYRPETLIGHYGDQPHRFDGTRYGGSYSRQEVKEVVRYAQERFITVIPEIEMPGHALAALSAYPELSCTGGPFEPATLWGVFDDVFCAGNDSVFAFLKGVLGEVAELFPGPYIHIGGDECPKTRWKECPRCQERIRSEGLKDEHELQSWFVRRIETILDGYGKKLIGWDEILEGGLAPQATVMSWRGMQGGIDAATQGHDVIMAPVSHCYFDHYQADPAGEPVAFGGLTTLAKVYSFEPTPAELDEDAARHVLGAQANIWTEYIDSPDGVEFMALPRMCALAEVVWSRPGARSWEGFLRRLDRHFRRLDAMEVNYRRIR